MSFDKAHNAFILIPTAHKILVTDSTCAVLLGIGFFQTFFPTGIAFDKTRTYVSFPSLNLVHVYNIQYDVNNMPQYSFVQALQCELDSNGRERKMDDI